METKEITTAIIKVMAEIKTIGKNTTVGKGNNSYKAVSEKDVKEAIRVSMIKNGLSIIPTSVTAKHQIDRWEEETNYGNKTKQSVFTEVATNYLLLHTSGESLELAGYGQGVDAQDKGAGKATTYALKNTLINLFLVPTGEDTDNTHSDDIAVPQKKQEVYTMTQKDVEEKWNGKIYGKSVYIDEDKKMISKEQIEKLKAHKKYVELPPRD